MSKEKDFYDEPQPGIINDDEKGLILQFSANGRNISDYHLDRSDILFLYDEIDEWLHHHPIDSDKMSDEEVKEFLKKRLMALRLSVGSSRAAKLLRELAVQWDD